MTKHLFPCCSDGEKVHRNKPDPSVYLLAPQLFDLKPAQVTMDAAHERDLQPVRKPGLRTAYVHRPLEHGPGQAKRIPPQDRCDIIAADFLDRAAQLST